MARTPKGNNAFALAHGNRLAADSTHGVTCTYAGGCRVFDANVNKKQENYWLCERHGDEITLPAQTPKTRSSETGFQGPNAECALLASVQNSERPQHSPATFRRSSTLDQ